MNHLPRNGMCRAQAATGDPPEVCYCCCQTELGPVWVGWTERGICWINFSSPPPGRAQPDASRQAEMAQILVNWLAGEEFTGPLDLMGLTPFSRDVLLKVREIPRGEVRSYAWVAREIGRPRAARAVGNTLARNPIPLLIPCHRVIRQSGTLGQYSGGGPGMKARLLALEGAVLPRQNIPLPSLPLRQPGLELAAPGRS